MRSNRLARSRATPPPADSGQKFATLCYSGGRTRPYNRAMRRLLRDILIGGAGGRSPLADAGLAVLRVTAGFLMAYGHGLGKVKDPSMIIKGAGGLGFPAPTFFGWMAALSELGGGIPLALGLATRPAGFLLACTMATAAFMAHARDPLARKEMALLYLAIAVLFVLTGSGRFGLDALLRGRGPRAKADAGH